VAVLGLHRPAGAPYETQNGPRKAIDKPVDPAVEVGTPSLVIAVKMLVVHSAIQS
jgi:hypothetical protein